MSRKKQRKPEQVVLVGDGGETWAPLPDDIGPYDVSDQGRVRNRKTGRILKGGSSPEHNGGHWRVGLTGPDGRRSWAVAQLVLIAFVEPPPFEGAVSRHRDDDVNNNTPGNLRWGTQADNMRDRARAGNARTGKRLTKKQVAEIHELAEDGFPQLTIAKRVGCTRAAVSHVLCGRYKSGRKQQ